MSSLLKDNKAVRQFLPTGVIFVVFVLLLGYFLLIEKDRPPASEITPTPTESYELLSFVTDDVQGVSLQAQGKNLVLTRNKETKEWLIESDSNSKADDDKVMVLIKDIQKLVGIQKVPDAVPSTLELDENGSAITVIKNDGSTSKLLVGMKTPTGERYYVQIAGKPEVYVVPSTVSTLLAKTADDVRWVPTPTPTATPAVSPTPISNTENAAAVNPSGDVATN